MRAMVVDGSKAMRTILKRLLVECGYDEVIEAGTGAGALAAIEGGAAPSLALVDAQMPEMTGIEFVAAARRNPACHDMILVVMTADTPQDSAQDAMAAGADDCLCKPFTKAGLLEKLLGLQASRG